MNLCSLIIDELLVKCTFLRKYVLTSINESLQPIFIVTNGINGQSIRFDCLSKNLGGLQNRHSSMGPCKNEQPMSFFDSLFM